MLGKDLISRIKNAELTGETSHGLFSPPYRPILTDDQIFQNDPRFAAVNILLYLKDNEWHCPLMVRRLNEHDRHSGRISVPGGSKDLEDKDFRETAIRETHEEMGIDKHYVRIIREISPIYIPPSNFYVHTFISFTKKNPTFILQESEAVELIEFPVSSLLTLTEKPEIMALEAARGKEVPVINFNNYIVWGATSMILSEFSNLLKNL